jgi:CYTH domain-containing protein/predicted ATPase
VSLTPTLDSTSVQADIYPQETVMNQDIKTITLTGGPGGGKSTTLAILRQRLEELGYVVITASESATDCMMDGITPAIFGMQEFQQQLAISLISREQLRRRALEAAPGEKKVLFLDRTMHDAAAYMQDHEYDELVASLGYSRQHLRDAWSDGVLFLRSPAVDKPEVYTTANNAVRRETLEEACLLDQRTLDIWVGCPHLRVIDNSTDMQGKALRVLQETYRFLGIPEPLEIERKYVVRGFDPNDLPAHAVEIDIEQHYLLSEVEGFSERIRRRGQHGFYTYYHTLKRDIRPSVRTEMERIISEEEYRELLKRVDPRYRPIQKGRICFVWENQYCELDIFRGLPYRLILLEVELTTEQDTVIIPPFLGVVEDVTDDPLYTNAAIARKREED